MDESIHPPHQKKKKILEELCIQVNVKVIVSRASNKVTALSMLLSQVAFE